MCDCALCIRGREMRDRLDRLPESERDYWEGIYEDLCSTECDLDYANAVIDGSWHDADEVIAHARARIALTDAGRAALEKKP